jgi:hypothetical protein
MFAAVIRFLRRLLLHMLWAKMKGLRGAALEARCCGTCFADSERKEMVDCMRPRLARLDYMATRYRYRWTQERYDEIIA